MNVNEVCLGGNLTRNAETRVTQSGRSVTNLRIATNESIPDGKGGYKDLTEYHSVVLWGERGEKLVSKEALLKGQGVYLKGKLRTRSWQGQDGVKRYTTEIVVGNRFEDFQLIPRGSQSKPQEEGPPPVGGDDFAVSS